MPPAKRKFHDAELDDDTQFSEICFADFFAGSANLTKAVQAEGVRCRSPDDLANGGVDFAKASDVTKL